jgi:mercuric ion transport protein
MPTVELVYDADCPNSGQARSQLLRAFARAGLPPRWQEWRADDPEAPAHVRGLGSPAVLVDGRDVAGTEPGAEARSCRLYTHGDGSRHGAPPVDLLVAALTAAGAQSPAAVAGTGAVKTSFAMLLPAVGLALLPKVACPACWPASAGVLSTLGLGFLLDTSVLLPLTAVFLAIAVGALAFRARRRRGFAPFALGVASAIIVLVGKFAFESDHAMYGGLGLLVGASLWNSWPRRRTAAAACTACVPEAPHPSRT